MPVLQSFPNALTKALSCDSLSLSFLPCQQHCNAFYRPCMRVIWHQICATCKHQYVLLTGQVQDIMKGVYLIKCVHATGDRQPGFEG